MEAETDPSELARRMRSVAEVFAHDEKHDEAAQLLILAVSKVGLSAGVEEKCKDAKKRHDREVAKKAANRQSVANPMQQLRALEAASELLASGEARLAPWPLTLRELGKKAGDPDGIAAISILVISFEQPVSLVRDRLFDSDATQEARKGTMLLSAAAEGDASRIEAALSGENDRVRRPPKLESEKQIESPLGLHEHPMVLQFRQDNSCDLLGSRCTHVGTHYRCAKGCDFDVCKACFEEGNQGSYAADEAFANQVTPLMLASRAAAVEAVKVLLEAGAMPNRRSKSLCTALSLAAEHPQGAEVVLALLEVRAQPGPDRDGRTPLIEAAQNGSAESVRHLINAAMSQNAAREMLNAGDKNGSTALMRAAQGGKSRIEVLNLLLEKGASINKLNNEGRSALFFACQLGQLSTAEALLEKGAKIDGCGVAPLHAAVFFGAVDVVKLLLNKRADVNIDPQDLEGMRKLDSSKCLETALEAGSDDVVSILMDHDAKISTSPAGLRGSSGFSTLSLQSYGSKLRSAASLGNVKKNLYTLFFLLSEYGPAI